MGRLGLLWFNEDDMAIIKEIAKLHGVSIDIVKPYYKEMLENIKYEVENED